MPEVMMSARTPPDRPALEQVAHPECRICHAANRGRTAARINNNPGGVKHYNAIIEAHPHRNDQADAEHQADDQAEPDNGDSPVMHTLRERVAEENGMRRWIRLDP
ncbi:hypothetical protein [Streptomyces sp. NPDC004042]|uniref:hypothetical protein n=1 Tax=Streptomyces sp. NPDC004042 TaxID=3154451 RepID=UPI0033B3A846